jgi:hypothetical protein
MIRLAGGAVLEVEVVAGPVLFLWEGPFHATSPAIHTVVQCLWMALVWDYFPSIHTRD